MSHVHAATIQTGHDMPASLTQFLCCAQAYVCRFLFHILWPEVYAQSHSDNGHVLATAPCSVHALAQAHPTMSYIPLLICHLHFATSLTHSRSTHIIETG